MGGGVVKVRWQRVMGWAFLLAVLGGGSCQKDGRVYEIVVGHSHYPNFREEHRVALKERFAIGDSDYEARIVRFEPDFALDNTKGEVFSRSEDYNNPAVQIEVFKGGKKVTKLWAFGLAFPHRGQGVPLTFRLVSVEDAAGQVLWRAKESGQAEEEAS
jgi:hypothetical protein